MKCWRKLHPPLNNRPVLILAVVGLLAARLFAVEPTHRLQSPNGVVVVDVRLSDRIYYDVAVADFLILKDATLSLRVDNATLGL